MFFMPAKFDFLKTQGRKIIDESGHEVRLGGFCLGSWLNLETLMVGFPSLLQPDAASAIVDQIRGIS